MSNRKHVFISHHHADDDHVSKLTSMMNRNGFELRNSSIRAKPANQKKLDQGLVSDNTIKRLLRMKMAWASTVIVLIGKDTHKRPWVDWEIKKAHELGKRIVGVYTRGGTENDVPEALDDYEDARVNWDSKSVMDAIEGKESVFEKPGGGTREPIHEGATTRC
ncbi:TIR domain-containing protein [Pseudovibrio ascidiaceicola]|uniref:TIR domain-containing protein n=1 Tax=Pseudovibrio ascidiaceicola TaxID=285279 RepID=UPI000D696B2F|nr:TIR domain-containing protein [Pseudovibrio ascidiaceicola]